MASVQKKEYQINFNPMPKYTQIVRFEREFTIVAKDAAAANERLEHLIREVEFDGNLSNDGYSNFEDDPVECPKCKGACVIGDDETECDRCKGDGSIPFVAPE